jgi:glucosamine 6-phosphate synthetase-like amidotransferase/phosphosugar isomerase protein
LESQERYALRLYAILQDSRIFIFLGDGELVLRSSFRGAEELKGGGASPDYPAGEMKHGYIALFGLAKESAPAVAIMMHHLVCLQQESMKLPRYKA